MTKRLSVQLGCNGTEIRARGKWRETAVGTSRAVEPVDRVVGCMRREGLEKEIHGVMALAFGVDRKDKDKGLRRR